MSEKRQRIRQDFVTEEAIVEVDGVNQECVIMIPFFILEDGSVVGLGNAPDQCD